MAYEFFGAGALNYYPCHYGKSKLAFRGPKRNIGQGYCAAIGGTETFGKFVEEPYPALLEKMCGRKVVNLGCMHAGADIFSGDPAVMEICRNADMTVMQLTGVPNMSNRFYAVHPRRNDRFIGATPLMNSIFQDLDFSDVHYTGHLLGMIKAASAARFDLVKKELQAEWVRKMKTLLARIDGPAILLWLSDRSPEDRKVGASRLREPMLLNRDMIDQLTGEQTDLVEIIATPDEISAGHDRMIYTEWEATAARQMLGPIAHQEAAREIHARLDLH